MSTDNTADQDSINIDPEVDHKLRVHVERIVRPIRAEEHRKLKMRRELYGHAVENYEKLNGQRGSEAALSETLRRMGDPVELTDELQAGVSWDGPYKAAIDRWTRRQPETPLWKHALWLGTQSGAALMLIMLAVVWPIRAINLYEVDGRTAAWFTLTLSVLFGANVVLGTWFGSKIRERIANFSSHRRAINGMALTAIAAGVMFFATGFLFVVALSLTNLNRSLFDLMQWGKFYAAWAMLSAIFVPSAIIVAWLDVRERRGLGEWLSLQIDQPTTAD